jgi:molybdate transport system substrate-binding protein
LKLLAGQRLAAALVVFAALAAFGAGCSGDDHDNGSGSSSELVVSAAASLSNAFPDYAHAAGYNAKFSFAGSDELAAQIRQGAAPDVYAAANTTLPDELHAEDLIDKPVVFATNVLMLAVPKGSEITSLDDLTQPEVKIAIGDPDVPIGAYTRETLDKLPKSESKAILANVASEEPDVLGIAAKINQGAVDAGFVYRSDVDASNGTIEGIELPARLEPDVAYGAGVVTDADEQDEARKFVDGLLYDEGQHPLRENGFLPPP